MKTMIGSLTHRYMARVPIFLVTVVLIAGIVGCVPAECSLTVLSAEGGEVMIPGEGSYTYYEGEVVNLVAVAEGGHRFVNWTGDVSTIAEPRAAATTIIMNGDYSITANFEAIPVRYNLTVSSTAGGVVTTPGEGTFPYDEDTLVNLVAEPDEGYQFVSWTGNVGTVANVNAISTTITVDSNYSVTATFEVIPPVQYSLTISRTSGGRVTVPGEGIFVYDAGTVVSLAANAYSGYYFQNWSGDVSTVFNINAASTTITMNNDHSIVANFHEIPEIPVTYYRLTLAVNGSGSASPSVGQHTYVAGTVVPIIATPSARYRFVNWTGDVGTIANVNAATTTITMNGGYSITANFVKEQYDLTIASTAGGNITTPGEGTFTYNAGTVVSLNATPSADYRFIRWIGDVTTIANATAAVTTITMNSDYNITACFEANFMVAGGVSHTVGVKSDGTVVAVGRRDHEQCNVDNWTGIIEVAAGWQHTVGLKSDGTVVAVGRTYYDECNVSNWTGIVQVAAGYEHTLGVRADGTVVAVGRNEYGQCDVGNWTGIVQVAADVLHTLGLKSDGTVVAVGWNRWGQCNVGNWTDIIQVATCECHTVGLKSDGTVIAVGDNYSGRCDVANWTDIVQVAAGWGHTVGLMADGTVVSTAGDVGGWTHMVQVAAGGGHTVGLKSDGTVVAVGDNYYGQCNVGGWTDIIQAAAGWVHTVGLKSDGTVVAVGDNYNGQCNVGGWTDIIQVAAGRFHTVGLKADGTVLAPLGYVGNWTGIVQVAAGVSHTVGLKSDGTVVAVGDNSHGQCDVGSWTSMNITQVAAGGWHTVGLKSDGTVVAVGDNSSGQCNVGGWTGIVQVAAGSGHTVGLKGDGTVVAVGQNWYGQCNVTGWTHIVQIAAASSGHTVGVKADGTVVAVGLNDYGQCNVSGWTDIIQVAPGYYHTVGLKTDGTAVAVGDTYSGQCDVVIWDLN